MAEFKGACIPKEENCRPDAGYDSRSYGQACHGAAVFMNGMINARLCGKPYGQSATP